MTNPDESPHGPVLALTVTDLLFVPRGRYFEVTLRLENPVEAVRSNLARDLAQMCVVYYLVLHPEIHSNSVSLPVIETKWDVIGASGETEHWFKIRVQFS